MKNLLKLFIGSILILTCCKATAQTTNPIFPYYSFGDAVTSFNDNSSIANIGNKKCYFNSYTFYIEKGAHFYVSLSSNDDMELVIRNKDNSIDSTFYESSLMGVNFQRLFIAPKTDSFDVFIVSLVNLTKSSYSFRFLRDKLFNNPIPAAATFENRLQSLLAYREMKFLPLKGKLISENPDMFQSVKKFATTYELLKGEPVYYIISSLPAYIITRLSKADSKAKAIIQLAALKLSVDKYFAANKAIEVLENKNKYNDNLPNYTYTGMEGNRTFITLDIEKGEDGFYYTTFKME